MKLLSVSVLMVAWTSLALAGDQPTAGDFGKAPAKTVVAMKARTTENRMTEDSQATAITSSPILENLATVVTIAANASALFQATSDFTGADKVGFSVTTLSDPSSRMTNVRFGIAWAAPGNWFVLTDMVLGSTFYYFDHGAATVPVYGPALKIAVFNDGSIPVTITQLSVYAVAR